MKLLKPIGAGSGIYLALELASYIDELDSDLLTSTVKANFLSITTLLGFFLPGLIAGFLVHKRPVVVGSGLGITVSFLYFALSAIFLGWDWAIAGIRLSPMAIPLLFALSLVFTYGGYTAAQGLKSRNGGAVT